jgi:hypothetical protein
MVIEVNEDTLQGKLITNNNTVADHFAIVKNITTSTKNINHSVNALQVYPALSKRSIHLRYAGKISESAEIKILDHLGNVISVRKVTSPVSEEIDISHLAGGMYIISLTCGREVATKRFVKE